MHFLFTLIASRYRYSHKEQNVAHVITRAARRGARAARSAGPATVAVSVALLIGAAGFADAATGGTFILGRSNSENATAVLRDSTGVPLSLSAPAGKAPLSVSSVTQVNRLNAQYVGGYSASRLQTTGGIGITAAQADISLPAEVYVNVASTGKLPAGTYYVSATALVDGNSGSVFCKIISNSTSAVPLNWGGGYGVELLQAAETTVTTVPGNTVFTESCYGEGSKQYAYNAAITAIRIESSTAGTAQAVVPQHLLPRRAPRREFTGPPQG